MINPVRCIRLFADDDGDTHFEDIEMPMSAIQYAPPAPAVHLSEPVTATRFSWFRFPADWNDDAIPRHDASYLLSWPAKSKVGQVREIKGV